MGTHAPVVVGSERVVRLRYPIMALVLAASTALAGGHGDWPDFAEAGAGMLGPDGLAVFARHHDIQTGPPVLLLARALALGPGDGFWAAAVLTGVAALVTVRALELAAGDVLPGWSTAHLELATLVGGSMLMATWGPLAGFGHLDDAVVVAATAIALRALAAGRPAACGAAIGVAAATKPWAIAMVPLLLRAPTGAGRHEGRARASGLAWAVAIPALVWAPFVVAAPDTLRSVQPGVFVADDSLTGLLTTRRVPPDWLRAAQLVAALAAGAAAAWARRWMAVPVVVVAVRMLTDGATWSYYTPALVAGALAFDLLGRRRVVPAATLLVVLTVALPALVGGDPVARGWLRTAGCLAVAALALWGPCDTTGRADA